MQWTLMVMVFCALGAEQPDTAVVCPPAFLNALAPWTDYRASQGHRVAVVSSTQAPGDIRAAIRRHAESGQLRYVLLVGDAEPAAARDAAVRARCTPTHPLRAKVNTQWGSEPELATDNWYADLDDDGVPELAVGRITADDEAELGRIVRKILAYEETPALGVWRRQVHLVAGLGGFGTLTDAVVEMAAKKLLADGIPAGYETSMTYGSWQSPYCPDPRLFRAITLQRLNSGGLFWVYIGHGQSRGLDELHVPGGSFPILDVRDAGRLRCIQGAPIAVLLACYAGAFDRPADCLAEELLRAPGGPVAVLCGSRVTMPYAMAVLGDALLDECFRHKRETLGEVVLHAKRRLAGDDPRNPNREILDAVAAALSPSRESLRDERLEHVALFNLLGDPLLRMHQPDELEVRTESAVAAGGRLRVSVRSVSGGTGVLELVCRRDRLKSAPPERPQFVPREDFLRTMTDTYRAANDGVWVTQTVTLEGGDFETEMAVPAAARGPCHVRAFLSAPGRFALGAAEVFVRRPEAETVADRGPKVVR